MIFKYFRDKREKWRKEEQEREGKHLFYKALCEQKIKLRVYYDHYQQFHDIFVKGNWYELIWPGSYYPWCEYNFSTTVADNTVKRIVQYGVLVGDTHIAPSRIQSVEYLKEE